MKILLLILLMILPVSNELIKQNMGDQFKELPVYTYEYESQYISPGPYKSPFKDDYYYIMANDGKIFIIIYRTIIGDFGVYVKDDGGLGLYGWYGSVSSMEADAKDAVNEYNRSLVPIGSPIYLLPFGLLYLLKKRKEQAYNE